MADVFRRHNLATLEAALPHYQDETRMLNAVRAGREELEELFAKDRERFERERTGGEEWR
jgi:glutathione-regulated potassium-efflux system ancillary protein KefC